MNWEDRIIEYYSNALSSIEREQLENKLKEDANLRVLFAEYSILFDEFDGMNLEQPNEEGKFWNITLRV